jgi:predicted metal-dependent peptidase
MNASDRIKKSHVAIMRHKKFCTFSGLLACGKVEITKDIPTACTDGWNRKYNPDFVDSLDDAQLNLLVLHECTHVAYAHLRMWKDLWKENAQLANHAADHFVNLALMDTDAGEGFVKMPTVGAQPDPQYRGKSVRQIFDMLKTRRL